MFMHYQNENINDYTCLYNSEHIASLRKPAQYEQYSKTFVYDSKYLSNRIFIETEPIYRPLFTFLLAHVCDAGYVTLRKSVSDVLWRVESWIITLQ